MLKILNTLSTNSLTENLGFSVAVLSVAAAALAVAVLVLAIK
ncbi:MULTISPECIES: hypothetical protein [Aeromonas]|jgi:hypothetical protein|nr:MULTISPECIES: hypothetical protein [Aeromonas]UYB73156.1 hypothetical protein NBH81_22030 [Aeromonas veronii]